MSKHDDVFTDRYGTPLTGGESVVVTGEALDIANGALYKAKVVKITPEESPGPNFVLCEATVRFTVSAAMAFRIMKI